MSHVSYKHQLAIVIATKDRPKEVRGLLSNISNQSYRPSQMVVVDGSDTPIQWVVEGFPELKVDYVRVIPPGLTKQKNVGVATVRPHIGLVGFIDDDIVLEDGCLDSMMQFWEGASDNMGGASFNLTDHDNSRSRLKSLLNRVMLIDNGGFGRVLRSGSATPIWNTEETKSTQWLGGGYTVWRKEVFDHFRFDEWFPGSGLSEDLQFSYQVSKRYDLAVVADARATHSGPPIGLRGQLTIGKRQITHRVYFVKSNPDLSLTLCLVVCVGRVGINLARGVVLRDLKRIVRGIGNALGLSLVALEAVGGLLLGLKRTVGRAQKVSQ